VSATVLAHRNTGLVRTIVLVLVLLLGATACTATAEAKKRHKHPNINKCRKKKHSDKNEREGPRPDGKKEHEDAARESCVPPSPGKRRMKHKKVKAHTSGHFKHFTTKGGEERANEDFPWRVRGKPVGGKLSPSDDPFSVSGGGLGLSAAAAVFIQNRSLQNSVDFCSTTNCSLPPDTSGADAGNTILVTGNWKSFGRASADGGMTFNTLDPTTIFPSGPTYRFIGRRRIQLDGGICCDQIVQYVPQINKFIWLMQFSGTCGGTCGRNKLRIAAASPSVVANGGSWTYWDLTSSTFGLPSSTPNMDYPDMAVGTNTLYVSVDNVGAGLLAMRIPLSQIASSSSINIGYTRPSDSATAYGGHLTQNVGDTGYWAGHVNNRTLRVFSMRDGENVYRWRDVSIDSWCNGANSSSVPGGTDWLGGSGGFPGNAVLGSTLRSDDLWFAWGAGHAMASGTPGTCNFTNSHIQIVVLDPRDYHRISQMQVWNSSIAFAYPSLASNTQGEVGMSLGYGGGSNHASHAVGFWGDFVVYTTTAGDTSLTRFGDYVNIRRSWPSGNLFSAEGYSTRIANATNNCPSNGTFAAGFGSSNNFCFDPHYVVFGRPSP